MVQTYAFLSVSIMSLSQLMAEVQESQGFFSTRLNNYKVHFRYMPIFVILDLVNINAIVLIKRKLKLNFLAEGNIPW